MTAKELLERIVKLRKAIDYRKTKVETLRAATESTTVQLTGMPRGHGENRSQMEAAACRKMDLEREIADLEAERKALIDYIDYVDDDDLSRLLTLRYVQEEKWEFIMTEMGYCSTHIYRIHQKAVKKLDEFLKDGSKNE